MQSHSCCVVSLSEKIAPNLAITLALVSSQS
uniref:Uncharacterized protein n=1 Tax=Myoviridae sp. ctfvB24 TaxID=2826679 RepID=A0A8S5M967_9CAUD|nr:MAG TPA: hypothetical protein [Myoviridae sp. ctfvB24]